MSDGYNGHPIGVAQMRIKVHVTENDIKWAVRDDSSRCMVARALAREVDDAQRIEVDTQTIRFSTNKGRFAYLTPLAVQRYVAAFDAGDPIDPFEFSLRNAILLKTRRFSPEERAELRLKYLTEARDETPLSSHPQKRASQPTKYSKEGRVAPPRVFKSRKRSYGHRMLRINQPQQHATALDERP